MLQIELKYEYTSYNLYTLILMNIYHIRYEYSLCTSWLFIIYFMNIHQILHEYLFYTSWIFIIYFMNIHQILHEYSFYTSWIFIKYIMNIHYTLHEHSLYFMNILYILHEYSFDISWIFIFIFYYSKRIMSMLEVITRTCRYYDQWTRRMIHIENSGISQTIDGILPINVSNNRFFWQVSNQSIQYK